MRSLIAALTFAFLSIVPVVAWAKPKPFMPSNGCTIEQIQAPANASCLNQGEQDIIAGRAYTHVLLCDERGVFCCQADSNRTFGCKKVGGIASQPGGGETGIGPSTK